MLFTASLVAKLLQGKNAYLAETLFSPSYQCILCVLTASCYHTFFVVVVPEMFFLMRSGGLCLCPAGGRQWIRVHSFQVPALASRWDGAVEGG